MAAFRATVSNWCSGAAVPKASESEESRWYALIVKPRVERHIATVLSSRGFEVFLPTKPVRRQRSGRVVTLDQPLFPSYVFACFPWSERLKVITSPGVQSIVSFSGVPVPVEDQEIARLRQVTNSPLPVVAWDYVASGTLVRVASGPLRGLEGRLVGTKSTTRLVINVEILQRAVAVAIDQADVEPLAKSHHA